MPLLDILQEAVRREAVRWDMRSPNRTPRGARQFAASLRAR